LWSWVAENSRTGTFTNPNDTDPVQIDLAMSPPPPKWNTREAHRQPSTGAESR
jgi:hypothetical protein